jgi:hypothetical protein
MTTGSSHYTVLANVSMPELIGQLMSDHLTEDSP